MEIVYQYLTTIEKQWRSNDVEKLVNENKVPYDKSNKKYLGIYRAKKKEAQKATCKAKNEARNKTGEDIERNSGVSLRQKTMATLYTEHQ